MLVVGEPVVEWDIADYSPVELADDDIQLVLDPKFAGFDN